MVDSVDFHKLRQGTLVAKTRVAEPESWEMPVWKLTEDVHESVMTPGYWFASAFLWCIRRNAPSRLKHLTTVDSYDYDSWVRVPTRRKSASRHP